MWSVEVRNQLVYSCCLCVSNGSCFCCRTLIWMRRTFWKIKSSVCGFILFWGPDSSCDLWNYFHWVEPVTNKPSPRVRLFYFTKTAPHPLLRGGGVSNGSVLSHGFITPIVLLHGHLLLADGRKLRRRIHYIKNERSFNHEILWLIKLWCIVLSIGKCSNVY